MKSREGYDKILLGDVHSEETMHLLKSGGLSKFEKYWWNTSTAKREDFDLTNTLKYYRTDNWKLVLENKRSDFANFPRFTTGNQWIKEDYSWQIE